MITHFRVHSRHFREECVFSLYTHSCVHIHTRIHTLGFKGAGGDFWTSFSFIKFLFSFSKLLVAIFFWLLYLRNNFKSIFIFVLNVWSLLCLSW